MSIKIKYWTLTLMLFVALGAFFELPARAYTDPGSCLLLFQSVGAVASGALFYFRRRLKRFFTREVATETVPAVAVSRAKS